MGSGVRTSAPRRAVTALAWLALVALALVVQWVLAIVSTGLQSCFHLSGEIVVFAIAQPPCTVHPHVWVVAALRFGAVLSIVLSFRPPSRGATMVASAAVAACLLRLVLLLPITMADGFGPGQADIAALIAHNRHEASGALLAVIFVIVRARSTRAPVRSMRPPPPAVLAAIVPTLAYESRFHESSGALVAGGAAMLALAWTIGAVAVIRRRRRAVRSAG